MLTVLSGLCRARLSQANVTYDTVLDGYFFNGGKSALSSLGELVFAHNDDCQFSPQLQRNPVYSCALVSVVAGARYYFRLSPLSTQATGTALLRWRLRSAPVNDMFDGRLALTGTSGVTAASSLLSAGLELGESSFVDGQAFMKLSTVWYERCRR